MRKSKKEGITMIYFDLDGSLVNYDRLGYVPNEKGVLPYKQPGYFYGLEENETALKLFKRLHELMPESVAILTGVSPEPEIRLHQIYDKMHWITDRVPTFDIGTKFIATSSPKMDTIEWFKERSLTKSDIIIDDWNGVLYSWMARGGTSIKYITDENSESSWVGPCIYENSPFDVALYTLLRIVKEAC